MQEHVPNPVVRRLSLYLREMHRLCADGAGRVSSRTLAQNLGLTAAQVRKDLACFGQFGRPGLGYECKPLMARLRGILGTDKTWNVVLVGVGGLGGALLRHEGFLRRGFNIVAAVDVDPDIIGRKVGAVLVKHVDELSDLATEHDIRLAIIAAPPEAAKDAVQQVYDAGIYGVLNFAPASLPPLDGLAVEPVDIASYLERLSFRVNTVDESEEPAKP